MEYLARIILPGIILGYVIGTIVKEKPFYLQSINPKNWISDIKRASRNKWIRTISISIIIGLLSIFIQLELGRVIIHFLGPLLKEKNIFLDIASFSVPIFLISITVLPILEEWIFRGIILEEISNYFQSKKMGLFLSSLLFALFHLSNPGTLPAAVITYFIGGTMLGIGYLVGGLSVAILAHILYNLLPFLL